MMHLRSLFVAFSVCLLVAPPGCSSDDKKDALDGGADASSGAGGGLFGSGGSGGLQQGGAGGGATGGSGGMSGTGGTATGGSASGGSAAGGSAAGGAAAGGAAGGPSGTQPLGAICANTGNCAQSQGTAVCCGNTCKLAADCPMEQYLSCTKSADCAVYGGGKICCDAGSMKYCTKQSGCIGTPLP